MESTLSCANGIQSTSEWLYAHTGVMRLQYSHLAIDQLISSITSMLASSDLTTKRKGEPSLLRDISELCLPIVHLPKALPIVEALLLQIKTGFSDLSDEFLTKVTELQRGYSNTTQLSLSYEARVALWSTHLPSFEQELLDLLEAVRRQRSSESPEETMCMRTLLTSRQLPKTCVECPQLFIYASHFFKVLFVSSEAAAIVVKLVREMNNALADEHRKKALRLNECPQLHIDNWFTELLPTS